MQGGVLAGMHLVDLRRLDLGAGDQVDVLGHDVEDRLGGPHHAAQRIGGRAVDDAGDRRADVEPFESSASALRRERSSIRGTRSRAARRWRPRAAGFELQLLEVDLGDLRPVLGDRRLGGAALPLSWARSRRAESTRVSWVRPWVISVSWAASPWPTRSTCSRRRRRWDSSPSICLPIWPARSSSWPCSLRSDRGGRGTAAPGRRSARRAPAGCAPRTAPGRS